MQATLAKIAEILSFQLKGTTSPARPYFELAAGDRLATGWSIDSRSINPGDLFFAIKGPRHDGHEHVAAAFEKGAIAAVVSNPIAGSPGPLLEVADVQHALQTLAQWARRSWGNPIVAVTGSAGKTTTKDAIAALLSVRLRVGKTAGNLNNYLGLPLSLLRLPDEAQVGVMELGMNHAGEIRGLVQLAEPEIGVVTNVGYAHIENFSSIDGIAAAKRELIDALPLSGAAVLNADDARVLAFRDHFAGRVLTYGTSEQASVRAENITLQPGHVEFSVQGTRFRSPLAGRHGVSNILAAIAVAQLFDIEPGQLVEAVAGLVPGKMRGERSKWNDITILDDSYNANPEAVRSMIDALREEPSQRRIAVLGEMLELGHWAEALHRDVGKYVAKAGIPVLVGIRGASRFVVDAAIEAGVPNHAAYFFNEPEQAGEFLRQYVKPGDAILFKGSRGTGVERAIAVMKS